jgi:hypothetical protein
MQVQSLSRQFILLRVRREAGGESAATAHNGAAASTTEQPDSSTAADANAAAAPSDTKQQQQQQVGKKAAVGGKGGKGKKGKEAAAPDAAAAAAAGSSSSSKEAAAGGASSSSSSSGDAAQLANIIQELFGLVYRWGGLLLHFYMWLRACLLADCLLAQAGNATCALLSAYHHRDVLATGSIHGLCFCLCSCARLPLLKLWTFAACNLSFLHATRAAGLTWLP